MAAIQDDHHVGPALRRLGDQHAQLRVREIPAAPVRQPAVIGDQSLVEPVRLEVAVEVRRELLGAVAGIVKERSIPWSSLFEVNAEGVDDPLTRGLLVKQDLQGETLRGYTAGQKLLHGRRIIAAAG